jgi:hypothetical protein
MPPEFSLGQRVIIDQEKLPVQIRGITLEAVPTYDIMRSDRVIETGVRAYRLRPASATEATI